MRPNEKPHGITMLLTRNNTLVTNLDHVLLKFRIICQKISSSYFIIDEPVTEQSQKCIGDLGIGYLRIR